MLPSLSWRSGRRKEKEEKKRVFGLIARVRSLGRRSIFPPERDIKQSLRGGGTAVSTPEVDSQQEIHYLRYNDSEQIRNEKESALFVPFFRKTF
mmetsp:Transcript_20930/g.27146  ORF Transcript_20930/g.27146 Transcript_20930/m.27146 type:complete len:94 (+) Transcript_20930:85-366(+)